MLNAWETCGTPVRAHLRARRSRDPTATWRSTQVRGRQGGSSKGPRMPAWGQPLCRVHRQDEPLLAEGQAVPVTGGTHLARLPQTPIHPEPSGGGQPQREGPGLRGLHRLMAKSGGRGRAAVGQGQRNISPAQHQNPGTTKTGAPCACLKPEPVSDPPNQRNRSPAQGCVGSPGPQQGSQPEGE